MSSNYKELYKKSVDLGEQQKLRQLKLLHEQKQRRQQLQDVCRQVAADSGEEDEDDEEQEVTTRDDAPMCSKKVQRKQRKQRATNNLKKAPHYRLQQSEWLRHRPENLCDWLLVPCPVGKRCLVMATNGRTKVYNKAGHIIMQLRSLLPGDSNMQKSKTVLDCVYVQELDTFYVLDAISFGQQLLLDCEASFRSFWLRSRFDEHGELSQLSQRNEKPFKLLKYYDFEDAAAVYEMLQTYPQWDDNRPQLDGMLFYHKEASYTCGPTPLVCWLFAYMLPDVLNLAVNVSYVPPGDYEPSAVLAYMDEFDKKLQTQRQQPKKPDKAAKITHNPDKEKEAACGMDEDNELPEHADMRLLQDQERRLELDELDMDCTPDPTDSTAVGSNC